MAELGLGDYVREAFKVPYNQILFFGGIAAGILTLHPMAVWPFVAAAELAYLFGMASHPRFQAIVRARRRRPAGDPGQVGDRLLATLDPARRERFQRVVARCRDLQRTGESGEGDEVAGLLESQQAQGVNKLLWVFLRTLVQEHALASLSASTPRAELEQAIARARKAIDTPGISDQVKTAHAENLEVLEQRRENLERAVQNLATLGARLERIENSIMLAQEQALTRRDPSFVEAEVKSVTEGLSSMEEVMRSMNLPALDTAADETIPEFVMPGRAESRETGR